MGCRIEIYVEEDKAEQIISISKQFDIEAQVIGRVEPSNKKELLIQKNGAEILY
jgi:phosphoribosylformylglycinamidine cyclo-ligase